MKQSAGVMESVRKCDRDGMGGLIGEFLEVMREDVAFTG